MTERWHLVTGEYPPATGGIARFTAQLAMALSPRDVHVWTPGGGEPAPGVTVHSLPDDFGRASRRTLDTALDEAPGDVVLLQYTPNAIGARGANVPFCLWVRRRVRRGSDIRVVFHEPFFYFARQSLARNALALVQRLMAWTLLRGARLAYVSSPSWQSLLAPYAPSGITWRWLPITIGLPDASGTSARPASSPAAGRFSIGHLGTYSDEIRPALGAAIREILRSVPQAQVVCVGKGSREFLREDAFDPSRVTATGELPEPDVYARISSCDLLFAPFVEGITARRTSVLTAMALGIPTVSTDGIYTEPLWRETGAVALVPAGDARAIAVACAVLARDAAARAALGRRARKTYLRHFAPSATLAALCRAGHEPT
ncbi:MAG TPA: glycosyltransferase [Vicinamibacterales bacterium]|nr:glycosyltransferase [Vicinamibacterales bacterium]